ncbi:UPF0214 yfeW [Fusarium albosuccineum]|uniref:UPF0214 yfeW n=1 Tax=Fusarium albosuccineum TaxID=1237068 RepID=A0A8H4LNH4_9HYPO|nr:UPF0214 yfeW [Fusarium albosuccineum]
MPSLTKLVAAVAIGTFALADAKACPPLGAVFPAPKAPSESKIVRVAAAKLKVGLEQLFAANVKTSALSIGVKSVHEDDPLFTYHFTPPIPGEGTEKVDIDTVFRIGSGSKLFTVLAALVNSEIDMEASVLKYLPELNETAKNDDIFSLKWDDITVGSLASHLSGIGADSAQDLGIANHEFWVSMGLPEIPKGKGPTCSGLARTDACTGKDLLKQVNLRPPVYTPFTNPVYSNIGIALLGLVVEAATGKSFAEVAKRDIYDVVGLKHTYVSETPPVEDLFIPMNETTWNVTTGVFESAGGMFSSVSDMLRLAEGIYTNKFLSPAKTRKWMKPEANTASWGIQVGGPWEILRGDDITSDGRLIDIYTKSGDLGLYHTQTVIVPDYDIVISIMAGGLEASKDQYVTSTILSDVLKVLIPAIEKEGRAFANEAFAGEYVDKSTNSSISFEIDDGPGLVIKSWEVRGFDVLNNIGSYNIRNLESGEVVSSEYVDARVYPTNLGKGGQTAWRAVFDLTPSKQAAEFASALFFENGTCQTWFQQDRKVYNFLGLDEFVFVAGDDEGLSTAVKNPAFNVTLTKVRGPAEKKDEPTSTSTSTSAPSTAPATTENAASKANGVNGALGLGLAASVILMSLF